MFIAGKEMEPCIMLEEKKVEKLSSTDLVLFSLPMKAPRLIARTNSRKAENRTHGDIMNAILRAQVYDANRRYTKTPPGENQSIFIPGGVSL